MATQPPPSPPEPLTLAEVKANNRVQTATEDLLFTSWIIAARQHVETYTGLVLTPRTVTETALQLGRWIDLDAWPVTAISAIRYPSQGVLTNLVTGSWAMSLARRPVRLLPLASGWGVGSYAWATCLPTLPIEIDVQAGYPTPGDVPQPIKQAMQMLVTHWWGNRAASEVGARAAAIEIPFGVEALLRPYRLARV